MKALVKSRREPGIWMVNDAPVPEVGVHDVMIRVVKSAICGTDVHIYNWDEWSQRTVPVPMVVGHEYVGEIVSLRSDSHRWRSLLLLLLNFIERVLVVVGGCGYGDYPDFPLSFVVFSMWTGLLVTVGNSWLSSG